MSIFGRFFAATRRGNETARQPSSVSVRERLDAWLDHDIPPRKTMFLFMFSATFLVYFGSFVHYARQQDFNIFSTPVGIVLVVAFFACLLVAAIFSVLGKTGLSFVSGVLLFLAIDLYVDWAWVAILAFFVGSVLALIRGVIVLHFLTVIFGITLLVAVAKGNSFQPFLAENGELSGDRRTLPPVVHLILDEHGPTMPTRIPGFSVWTGANSRTATTTTSVPEMVQRYLVEADQLGYQIEFWGNGHVDLCAFAQKCVLHSRGTMRGLMASDMPSADKALLPVYGHLRSTNFIRAQLKKHVRAVEDFYPTAFNSALALSHLNHRVGQLKEGELIIAHMLLPHSPYIYDADCRLKPLREWGSSQAFVPISERREEYEAQRACLYDLMQPIMDSNATIVLHGDHGTRIFPDDWNALRWSNSEALFDQAFRTLFAIRLPDGEDQIFEQDASVSSLLEELVASGFSSLPKGRPETVFVSLNEGEWIERQIDFRDRKTARDVSVIPQHELETELAK